MINIPMVVFEGIQGNIRWRITTSSGIFEVQWLTGCWQDLKNESGSNRKFVSLDDAVRALREWKEESLDTINDLG